MAPEVKAEVKHILNNMGIKYGGFKVDEIGFYIILMLFLIIMASGEKQEGKEKNLKIINPRFPRSLNSFSISVLLKLGSGRDRGRGR